jgi:putative MATE family efflux protein
MQRRGAAIDDTKPVWRTMLVFLIPLMLSNILQSASGTFTSIFLGRMIGVGALAAASSIFPMLFFLISFFIGISSGSTVLIGQAYGAGDTPRLLRAAGTTLTFAVLLGIVVGLIGLVFDRAILSLIGTPHDIFENAAAYARVVFLTMPVTFVYLAYTTFLRGVGDSRTPFVALLATTILGIILTPLLIAGAFGLPALGVIGAPIANITATAAGTLGLLVWLEMKGNPLAFGNLRRALGLDVPLLLSLVRIGIPTGLQFVMVSLSEIAVITFVNRFGSHATAAYGAVNQVVSYVQFPAISIGIASSIFGAQSIGAQRVDRLTKIVRSGVTLNYIIGGVLIALVYLLDRPILALFITDGPTLEIAVQLLKITLWSYVIFGNTSVLSGVMRSSGTVLWPTALSILAIWGVEVPVAYVLSSGPLGLQGIWIAYPIAFICALAFQSIYYFGFWRRRPIRALHASPLADAEGEEIDGAAAAASRAPV